MCVSELCVAVVKQEPQDTFVCLFVDLDQCNCQVKFWIYAIIKLEMPVQGKHLAETQSHILDKLEDTKFLTVPQSAAIERIVAANPTANRDTTSVWHCLVLLPDQAAKISPSKQRMVQCAHCAVSKTWDRALQLFTQGERLDGD
jgi:hypothetical protein